MSDLSSFLSTQNNAWSTQLWDGLIEAIGARLAPLEENLGIQREVTDAIIARGLTVIEQELTPIVNNAEEYFGQAQADLDAKTIRFEKKVTGGTVVAFSTSSSNLVLGGVATLVLDPADREFFATTPYVAISRASTVNNWAIGKVNSFNRTTGLLSVTLEKVEGTGGPYTDWVITSLPGATMLQKYYYEQTVALRAQVATDKSGTAADKNATETARDESINARSGAVSAKTSAEQVYADMRKAVAAPVVIPTNPVEGQLWWDGEVTRVYQSGVGFVPTVTVSIGGRRYEKGIFGVNPDGVINVAGGFTAALVFVNGTLLDEDTHYTSDSPTITVLNAVEGDRYFIEAYLSTSAVDYYTKEQVDNKVGEPNGIAGLDDGGKVPPAQLPALTTTATVGAAMAGANGKAVPDDSDFFGGVLAGGSTMFKATWGNLKAALRAAFDLIYPRLTANNNFTGLNDFGAQIQIKGGGYPQMRLVNAAGGIAATFYADTTTNFARIETYTFAGAVWGSLVIKGGGYNDLLINGATVWNTGNLPGGAVADISGSNASYKVFSGQMIEARVQAVAQAWVPFQAAGFFSTTIADQGYVWQNATGKPVMITGSIVAAGAAQAEISAQGSAYEQIAGAVSSGGSRANFAIMIPPGWFFRFLSTSGTTNYSLRLQRF
ncbi:hypothetical protein [Ochrobactrum sp. A-1]|uniref:hypothetical protein n=1 Tax=Ochrobactrum sp. A-1 TaxID=2920940 RepID=UPI001F0A9BEA|nr:hypothetical protein [Ochrobactrum sp. A-1]